MKKGDIVYDAYFDEILLITDKFYNDCYFCDHRDPRTGRMIWLRDKVYFKIGRL